MVRCQLAWWPEHYACLMMSSSWSVLDSNDGPFFQSSPSIQGWIFCHVTLLVLAFSRKKLNWKNWSINKKVERGACLEFLADGWPKYSPLPGWLISPFKVELLPTKIQQKINMSRNSYEIEKKSINLLFIANWAWAKKLGEISSPTFFLSWQPC